MKTDKTVIDVEWERGTPLKQVVGERPKGNDQIRRTDSIQVVEEHPEKGQG